MPQLLLFCGQSMYTIINQTLHTLLNTIMLARNTPPEFIFDSAVQPASKHQGTVTRFQMVQ